MMTEWSPLADIIVFNDRLCVLIALISLMETPARPNACLAAGTLAIAM